MSGLIKLMHCAVLMSTALVANLVCAAVPTKILGFEDMSCRAWVASRSDAEQRALYVAWLRGVLTGHNYANPSQQVATISPATVEQYVNRYCSEKPATQFSDAAFRLSDQFSGRNAPITK
ncbi:MAG TPA: hypothetical protein PKA30_02885 [Accumulibacter sp.]|uniref:HdeA/HdeB family chaperone n=2 Tax=Accumulibacter sp. TaxID=2053492 RepID=UPI0028784E5C|nr:hypothetical protein [Accumulibacter sp.]MDS4055742.1 hypothetical protein [Accumulibacter sp.]HMV04472.1 hypothetical protein [Accumulibacter sp.]HMW64185.1 hypothetical protein [Accumulibacter sp.]HMW79701.1 hypothetical protein [Accumulibacter sp.]HMX68646.1 hypothetical protein [Accumulibacter sp.]